MKIPLSDRLRSCCNFIAPGDRVADVGCDHGYLGIWLLTQGIASFVFASDVREGPLQSARRNAQKYGTAEKMSFHLSDGVQKLPRDFDTLVCAGMGGDTMISILEAAPWLKNEKYRLILQCQSRRPELRRYLSRQGYRISRETLARDGKFLYPVMEVTYGAGSSLTPAQCHISPALLESGSPLLPEFVERVIGGLRVSVEGLSRSGGEKYEEFKGILKELEEMEEWLHDNGC